MTNIREIKKDFIRAIEDGKQISFPYFTEDEGYTHRSVDPWYFFKGTQYYYLFGYCHLQQDIRTFNCSRIEQYKILKLSTVNKPIAFSKIVKASDAISFFDNLKKFVAFGYPIDFEQDIKSLGILIYEKQNANISMKQKDKVHSTRYPLTLQLSKMPKPSLCRSPLEHKTLLELNEDSRVISIEVEPFKIPYSYQRISRFYKPDILTKYVDGSADLIEVKLSGDIGMPKNQAKFKAAVKFSTQRGYRFYIIGIVGNSNSVRTCTDWELDSISLEKFDPNDTSYYSPHANFYKQNFYSRANSKNSQHKGKSVNEKLKPNSPRPRFRVSQRIKKNNIRRKFRRTIFVRTNKQCSSFLKYGCSDMLSRCSK